MLINPWRRAAAGVSKATLPFAFIAHLGAGVATWSGPREVWGRWWGGRAGGLVGGKVGPATLKKILSGKYSLKKGSVLMKMEQQRRKSRFTDWVQPSGCWGGGLISKNGNMKAPLKVVGIDFCLD